MTSPQTTSQAIGNAIGSTAAAVAFAYKLGWDTTAAAIIGCTVSLVDSLAKAILNNPPLIKADEADTRFPDFTVTLSGPGILSSVANGAAAAGIPFVASYIGDQLAKNFRYTLVNAPYPDGLFPLLLSIGLFAKVTGPHLGSLASRAWTTIST